MEVVIFIYLLVILNTVALIKIITTVIKITITTIIKITITRGELLRLVPCMLV